VKWAKAAIFSLNKKDDYSSLLQTNHPNLTKTLSPTFQTLYF